MNKKSKDRRRNKNRLAEIFREMREIEAITSSSKTVANNPSFEGQCCRRPSFAWSRKN